jgi:hypothetical protein
MTRLPQLEQELVAAAARLGTPRGMLAPVSRAVLAAAAVLAAVALVFVLAGGRGDDPPRPQPAAAPPFAPDAKLEDVLGTFRAPPTAADDMGPAREEAHTITDRQPGEDPSRSRRVEWPGESIFLWPMRDGVCWGVRSRGGCVPLDHLRQVGVSVGIQAQGQSVSGVVVDGIEEVVVTSRGDSERRVPVRENFFFVDAGQTAVRSVSWSYRGEEQSVDVERLLEPVVVPAPPVPDGAPNPNVEPLADSASDPLEFTVAGIAYTAVGFQTARSALCMRLTETGAHAPSSLGCLSERILRDALERQPAHVFAGGGGDPTGTVVQGFARSDAVELTAAERTSDVTVVLSEPWSPEPWEGEPIRFFFAFDRNPGPVQPRRPPRVPLEARLDDGRVVPIP